MIGLVRAELLKIRRRQATYILLVVEIVLAAFIFLPVGAIYQIPGIIEFPAAYAFFKTAAFDIGGLIAMVFAAAYVGGDWTWGVLRNVVARGESRERYLLAKTIALAIVLAIFLVVIFAACFALSELQSLIYNVPLANPLRGNGLQDLLVWIVVGYPVLLQRATIGLAVAAIFRSQLAGAVVGIILFLVETVLTAILSVYTLIQNTSDSIQGSGPTVQPGPEWFQYLPISIGGGVFSALPGNGGVAGAVDVSGIALKPVPFEIAMACVLLYTVGAVGLAMLALRRQEIA